MEGKLWFERFNEEYIKIVNASCSLYSLNQKVNRSSVHAIRGVAPMNSRRLLYFLILCACVWLIVINFSRTHRKSTSSPFLSSRQECDLTIHMITIMRTNKFEYLEQTLTSIRDNLQNQFFKPCVVLFHMRANDTVARQELDKVTTNYQLSAVHHISHIEQIFNTATVLSEKKKIQANDFLAMMMALFGSTCNNERSTRLIMIMEDDFVMCPGSVYHIMGVLRRLNASTWSGIRFSYGLNGIIFTCHAVYGVIQSLKQIAREHKVVFPVDWQVEAILNYEENTFSRLYLDQQFFIYRFNLMEHIGVISSISNNHNNYGFPQCYETQSSCYLRYEFHIAICGHSLFTPCSEPAPHQQIQHDTVAIQFNNDMGIHEFAVRRATHVHDIDELQKLNVTRCNAGLSCTECCSAQGHTCAQEFFPYLNKCTVLERHFICSKCTNMWNWYGPSPHRDVNSRECFVATRLGRLNCNFKVAETERLCPCKQGK